MKTIIGDIVYDHVHDTFLGGEDVILPCDEYETLRQTADGHYYIHTSIPQIFKEEKWRAPINEREWYDYVDDQNARPWDGVRRLEAIRSLSRGEARRWCAAKLSPNRFPTELLGDDDDGDDGSPHLLGHDCPAGLSGHNMET
jgi:hypothetical protein